MKNHIIISIVVAAIFGNAFARDLPDFIQVCKRTDPNANACITDSVHTLKPHLMKGLPEYNIPSLEPLLLKELVAAAGTLTVTAKDVYVYGASDFEVRDLMIDFDTMKITFEVGLPNIFMQGLYEVDGKVLLLPIRGSGPMSGNFTDCTGAVMMQGVVSKGADGQDYLHFSEFQMNIAVGHGSLKLDNLFGGEPVLGEVINTAINSNFDAFLKELQPLVEAALTEAFVDIANSIVGQFTFDQLFPE